MFNDRVEAGKQLAKALKQYRLTAATDTAQAGAADTVVLALPRGGVVTGREVADALAAPLDIIAVRKIGHPLSPEYAIGAVDENGTSILNEAETKIVDQAWLRKEIEREKEEALRRSSVYRAGRAPLCIGGKTVIIVDDGIATGLTMRLAVRSAKQQKAAKIVVAVPVATTEALQTLRGEGAETVVVEPPEKFVGAIGAHYLQFEQVGDDEVIELLKGAAIPGTEVAVKIDGVKLEGTLLLPENAKGIVVFAHGSGSSRFSPRNMFVAKALQKARIGTLLIDLLTAKEDEVYETRFDIGLLSERLGKVVHWALEESATKDLAVGLFGASTGAAAALKTAAERGRGIVAAVVSRGGRPDLALDSLPRVESPTLLIVGGEDYGVIELNERALAAMKCARKLEIISGATHLFGEPGALEKVAELAADWFTKYFAERGRTIGEGEGVDIPPKFKNSADTPKRPSGKKRGAAKEGYRHFHHKK